MGSAPNSLDVLIVGAGPVGLALALDLGRRGVRSTIVEQHPGADTEIQAKASVLDERTMEYCRLLGVVDQVANSGYPDDLPGDTVFCTGFNGKFIGRLEMPAAKDRQVPPESSEMMRRCPQFLFDPILQRAVVAQKMTDIRYGMECVGCKQDDNGVTIYVKDVKNGQSEEIRARYVVACDGPASTLRKALGISFDGHNLGHSTSATVRVDLARYHSFGKAERYVFIIPEGAWGNFTTIDGENLWRFTIVGVTTKIDLDTLDIHGPLRQALGCEDAEFEVIRKLQWRRSQFVAEKYNQGRMFLAGDAAHVMSPTGGHGLNTGLGDARDLSWILQGLLQGWGGKGLIDAYNTERRPISLRNSSSSSRNFQIWKDRAGRDKVLEDGPEADEQRRVLGEKLAATVAQEFQALGIALGYNYTTSPLVVPDGSPAPPDDAEIYVQTARPGHRAPHDWLGDGKSTLDLFGNGFVLLCLGTDAPGDQKLVEAARELGLPLELITITDPKVVSLYQTRLVLVRPDGMVAWRGQSLPDDVRDLLDRVRGWPRASIAR
jgi:2-polyprenyl-6-methoxyphenol hydroxylase-like FAD-dependent oxidoreductase